jgi:hypothetical protein
MAEGQIRYDPVAVATFSSAIRADNLAHGERS